MKIKQNKTIISIPFIILITILFIVYFNINKTHGEKSYWVEHTHKAIILSENLLNLLVDMETGQRGYLLTKNLEYLEPFEKAKERVYIKFSELVSHTDDNLNQQKRFEKIKLLIDAKIDELQETIDLTKNQKFEDALAIVNSDRGKEYMDNMRVLMQEVIDEEKDLLSIRKNEYNSIIDKWFIFNIGFILFMLFFIFRNQKLLKKAYDDLKGKNDELELSSGNLKVLNQELKKSKNKIQMINEGLEDKIKQKVEEVRNQERILLEQSKLASMGEMIGNIAHQWRQPLSVITTSASGIKLMYFMKNVQEEKLNKNIENILKQSKYLSSTIDSFKNFIKGDSKIEEISVKSLIGETLELENSSMSNNFVTLVSDIDSDIKITSNKIDIIQTLINILNNSIDAIMENVDQEQDRYIFLSTKVIKDNSLELEISDSAGGIPKEVLPRMFEPYFTTKHQKLGTGLGLAMTYQILVERYKYDLKVSNKEYEYKGKKYKGACFKIIFS